MTWSATSRRPSTTSCKQETKDGAITQIIDKWNTLAGPLKAQVVGTHTEDILGDSGGNRGIETPMADVVADAILAGTDGANEGGAQIAFMNVGGVREDLPMAPKYSEAPGQITYAEAFDIAPFNNLLVSIDLTGDQIRQVLEQQYQPVAARGSRPMLAMGVSKGFTYTWDASQPQGSRVVNGSMALNGTPLEATKTYRVGTLNFLADGGDLFTAFKLGTNRAGGPEDLANLVGLLRGEPGPDRSGQPHRRSLTSPSPHHQARAKHPLRHHGAGGAWLRG